MFQAYLSHQLIITYSIKNIVSQKRENPQMYSSVYSLPKSIILLQIGSNFSNKCSFSFPFKV